MNSLSRAPEAASRWLEKVCSWEFQTVVPAHFDAPLRLSPSQFASTFGFLEKGTNEVRFCEEDVLFLNQAIDDLDKGPPDLALYQSPLGPLRGKKCDLLS